MTRTKLFLETFDGDICCGAEVLTEVELISRPQQLAGAIGGLLYNGFPVPPDQAVLLRRVLRTLIEYIRHPDPTA